MTRKTQARKMQKSRRDFLKKAATMSLLGSGAGAMSGKLGLVGSALAASGDYSTLQDYKALVCVFLYGGSDSFNMFVPTETSHYTDYSASRGSLAVDSADLLAAENGVAVGFNPRLGNLRDMFDAGDLAIVRNVGNLIEPVVRDQYLNESLAIPPDLFAHNHQQEQWLKGLSSEPVSLVESGWGGRMADLLQDANLGASLPPSFALDGTNWWLPGSSTTPMRISSTGGLDVLDYLDSHSGSSRNAQREASLEQILSLSYQNPMQSQAGATFKRAQSAARDLSGYLSGNELTTPYNSSSRLGAQLRMVARLISGHEQLGMKRQIFFVSAGGWDTHDNQNMLLDDLLASLDRDLYDFQQTMLEINKQDSVTTFTASDFGRTLTVNGDGSDHGWGGHYLTMGGAVAGGQLYGDWPSFEIGGEDDTGDKGRIIPKLSINQYGASLAQWMGLSASDINTVFPDLANFGSDWQQNLQLFG